MFGGPVSLLVLLGVVMAAAAPAQQVTENLMHVQDFIAKELDLTKPAIGGSPLFGSVIRSINTSCQSVENLELMNATLDVYMQIFSRILHHHHHHQQPLLGQVSGSRRSKVKEAVVEMQQMMENLRSHLNPRRHNRDDVLKTLNTINVDDPTDQKKALAEFVEVFQTASVIGSRNC